MTEIVIAGRPARAAPCGRGGARAEPASPDRRDRSSTAHWTVCGVYSVILVTAMMWKPGAQRGAATSDTLVNGFKRISWNGMQSTRLWASSIEVNRNRPIVEGLSKLSARIAPSDAMREYDHASIVRLTNVACKRGAGLRIRSEALGIAAHDDEQHGSGQLAAVCFDTLALGNRHELAYMLDGAG